MEPFIALPRLLLPLLVVTLAACSQAVPAPVESARAAMAAPVPGKTVAPAAPIMAQAISATVLLYNVFDPTRELNPYLSHKSELKGIEKEMYQEVCQ